MARKLVNEFSWSKSRHEKLSECLRAYYFHYYASWGGWERDAAPRVRQLYLLKKLTNRHAWAGTVVHDAIRDALLDVRAGRPLDEARILSRAHALMRADFKHSRAKGYWREKTRKEFTGLVEHEYDEPVPAESWKGAWTTVEQALGWFFRSRWVELARSLKPEQWLEVDAGFESGIFFLDGVKVFAVPDFAYLDADGHPVVVDWKTGQVRDGYDEQVLGYALYLSHRYRLPVEQVEARLVYVNSGEEVPVRVDPAALAAFRAHFTRSVERMRGLLADVTANEAGPEEQFPPTNELRTCARCNFRRLCGRESAAPQVA
ncbi:MAG: PD-(D/E)XK nuclease family protein [Myxococcaceae bacterium]|nr:PD-(D/E)XK nuclease family protein [Myxococcaceae bacterium]MCI0672476.1 PD-(D/E)XK nuclease family protein [Myxococcaceae bacterium]